MKQKLLTDHLLGVVVPKESHSHKLWENSIRYKSAAATCGIPLQVVLSNIYYLDEIGEIIGLSSAITEEQADKLVECEYEENRKFWKDYNNPGCVTIAPTISLRTLIQSSGLTVTPEEDVLLIKIL